MCLYHAGTCIAMYFCFVFETEEWNSNMWPEVFFLLTDIFLRVPPLCVSRLLSVTLSFALFVSLSVCLCCKPCVIKL